jgi:XTP/dITP diphosphohydrolase
LDIVIATRNKKKIEEVRRLLSGLDINIVTIDNYGNMPEIIEDGNTFEENALKKARAIAQITKKPALADDSGLQVDALGGAPGIYSARYAGDDSDDRKNIEKLLKEMKGIKDRRARFVCIIAFALPDGSYYLFEGVTEGTIGEVPKGEKGFGYDPIFYPDGYDKTFAEMESEQKDFLSHRGKALRKFKEFIKENMRKF